MKRDQRLRTTADFARVRDLARRGWPHPLLVLYVAPNERDRTRVGITVSSRVGKAVVRNRVRRRIREALRARLARVQPGLDLVVVARPASRDATWAALNEALDLVLRRAAIYSATTPTNSERTDSTGTTQTRGSSPGDEKSATSEASACV